MRSAAGSISEEDRSRTYKYKYCFISSAQLRAHRKWLQMRWAWPSVRDKVDAFIEG